MITLNTEELERMWRKLRRPSSTLLDAFPATYQGMRVIEHPPTVKVRRKWWQRIWKPWVKWEEKPNPLFEDGNEIYLHGSTLHVTHGMAIRLRSEFGKSSPFDWNAND